MPVTFEQSHRPWPAPARPWSVFMRWHELLFIPWTVPAAALRPFVPARLELDTFGGEAWLGVVPFRMSGIRKRLLPAVPGTAAFPELNVRTYVTAAAGGGRPGVWFFSLDAANRLAVRVARWQFHLPYFDAAMSCTRAPDATVEPTDAVSPDADHIHRANVPGAWEHGGEVDRFEAELVAGAEGEPADDADDAERASVGAVDTDAAADADLGVDERSPDGDVEDRADERADRAAAAAPPPTGGAITASGAGDPARGKGGFRFLNFLRACWAELQRVQWPDRRQVGQATMVVLGFLVIAGAFLGLADYVAERVVDLII